jgi:hypothetical protein
MRSITFLAVLASAACASGASTVGSTRPVSTSIAVGAGGSGDRLTVAASNGPNINTLAVAPAALWKVLPGVFDSVSVPVARMDVATKTIGNEGFKIRQRLGKTPLSRYFDCGQTQIGPNADSYEMYVTVLLQVVPDGTGSKLMTHVEASARPLTFSQGYSRCSSKGSLEAKLLEAVKAQLK